MCYEHEDQYREDQRNTERALSLLDDLATDPAPIDRDRVNHVRALLADVVGNLLNPATQRYTRREE